MSDDEDFICYGTPIEQDSVFGTTDSLPRKAPRLEDEVVVDKQGKRRFHGAFTGGFSAGYFNSVGTKEGWAPSTFVSSRGQKKNDKPSSSQRPQDFMDDEDFNDFGFAPQRIQTKKDYDSNEYESRKRKLVSDGPIPGEPVLHSIVKPVKETMGMKLLRKLGWREGQGIGPRISYKEKMKNNKSKTRRPPLSIQFDKDDEDYESGDEDLDFVKGLDFAREDTHIEYLNKPKDNQFGLGYKPLSQTPVLGKHVDLFDTSSMLSITEKKKKLLIKGQAFGVGAFEEDDADIYSSHDMSDYDFALTDEVQEKESNRKGTNRNKDLGFVGITRALEGFQISSGKPYKLKEYLPPQLPDNYVPHHKPRRQRRFEQIDSAKKGLGRHDISANDRSRILSNQTTKPLDRSEPNEDQNPISSKPDKNLTDTSDADAIYEEFGSAKSRLSTDFKPFAKDAEKQKRYDLYLKMKEKRQQSRFHHVQPKHLTEWEREREIREFERASMLFKPLASAMSSRFVTASSNDGENKLKDGLNLYNPEMSKPTEKETPSGILDGSEVDDRVKAAKVKLFGKLTQYTLDWYPDSLLSRRFNVAPPYSSSGTVGVPKNKNNKQSIFNIMSAPIEDTAGLQRQSTENKDEGNELDESNLEDLDSILLPPDDLNDPATYGLKVPIDGKPSQDLFKSIFLDSDDDDKNEDEDTPHDNSTVSSVSNFISQIRHSKPSHDHKTENYGEICPTNIGSTNEGTVSSMMNNKSSNQSTSYPFSKNTNSSLVSINKEHNTDSLLENNDEFRPTFIKKRKETTKPSRWSNDNSIFSGIDFQALNKFRDQPKESESNEINKEINISDSSDSEDTYGPLIPPHLKEKNSLQTIRETPPMPFKPIFTSKKVIDNETKDSWVEKKSKKSKTKDKHKHKKHKKEKKKKHKKKSKKHSKSKYSSSSDSSSDSG